ncbi:hypothetical protein [Clostridium saccharoperbutylacetonicum]
MTIPNSLNNTYSYKETTLITLESIKQVLNNKYEHDKQILLLTSCGFIKCDIDLDTTSEAPFKETNIKNQYKLDLTCINNFRNAFINKLEEETPNIKICDNGAILNLKNVTIYSGALSDTLTSTVKLDELIIFVDQITGFSLIPRTIDK